MSGTVADAEAAVARLAGGVGVAEEQHVAALSELGGQRAASGRGRIKRRIRVCSATAWPHG